MGFIWDVARITVTCVCTSMLEISVGDAQVSVGGVGPRLRPNWKSEFLLSSLSLALGQPPGKGRLHQEDPQAAYGEVHIARNWGLPSAMSDPGGGSSEACTQPHEWVWKYVPLSPATVWPQPWFSSWLSSYNLSAAPGFWLTETKRSVCCFKHQHFGQFVMQQLIINNIIPLIAHDNMPDMCVAENISLDQELLYLPWCRTLGLCV